jgi:hypothetical protein
VLIEEIEDLRAKLSFEQDAYDEVVTPNWYILERLSFRMCAILVGLSSRIVDLHVETFDQHLASLVKKKNYFAVAQLIQRGLESCRKSLDAIEVWETSYHTFRKLDKSQDYKWAEGDWKRHRERLEQSRANMMKTLSGVGSWLSLVPESPAVPDYFGFAYTVNAEECFRALATGDLDHFNQLFPQYLGMVRLAANRIKQSLSKFVDPNTAYIADPFIDLISISGYAAIYSDLFKEDFRSVVTQSWDQFLQSLETGAVGFIQGIGALSSDSLSRSQRDMLRFKWKIATEDILRSHGIGKRDYFGGDVPQPPADTTALLLAFAHSSMIDADTIFQAQYLFKRTDAQQLPIPESVKSFNDSVQRLINQGAP